ncbi:Uncharacterised protein [Vibrio cholerae]|nr:Uncharacterised protein [Vibrio cholerae]
MSSSRLREEEEIKENCHNTKAATKLQAAKIAITTFFLTP